MSPKLSIMVFLRASALKIEPSKRRLKMGVKGRNRYEDDNAVASIKKSKFTCFRARTSSSSWSALVHIKPAITAPADEPHIILGSRPE